MSSAKQWAMMSTFVALAALNSAGIGAQALSARATDKTAAADPQLKALRQQLSLLEGRVHELEKKAEDVKNNSDDDAKEKQVDKRLLAIEQAQQKLQSEQDEAQQQGSAHAKAPFVVYDADNHPIFRVELNPQTHYARVSVGNPLGARMVMFANDQTKTAGMQLIDGVATGQQFTLIANETDTHLTMTLPSSNQSTYLGAGDGNFGLRVNGPDSTLAFFGSKNAGKGYLELSEGGSIMVEAGALNSHKGYVLATPYRSSVDPRGNPSVLQGGAGR
ncbi:MAG: hypothetical protein ABI145_02870 [Steroidobacteraceae bacterium]